MYFLIFLIFSQTQKQAVILILFILGQSFDYCRDDDVTSDNEHYPKCGKGLMCDTSTKSWGFCKEGICLLN